jgi:deoxyribonucleoside regulator
MLTDGKQDVLRAATMYYLQDMKTEAIARHLRTSRSTVSRLLKRARDTGLVEITLRAASTRAPGLGQSMSVTFGVATFVVPVPDTTNDSDRLEPVALTSAKLLASWFHSGMVMGIAWGTTLAAVSRHLTHKPTRGSAVVQLNGAANDRTSGVDHTGNLISTFGSAFDAAVRIGEHIEVLVEGIDEDTDELTGRAAHQGPDVDGATILRLRPGAQAPAIGEIIAAMVLDTEGIDLIAEPG